MLFATKIVSTLPNYPIFPDKVFLIFLFFLKVGQVGLLFVFEFGEILEN